MYHKYYMFMNGFLILSISVQQFKNCSRDSRNGHIQWNTHINKYRKKHNLNVWLDLEFEPRTPASLVRYSNTFLSRSINIHGPSRQTTTFLTLQSFCPLRNTIHPVRTYWFNKYLIKDGHSTKCNTEERKYRNKQLFT